MSVTDAADGLGAGHATGTLVRLDRSPGETASAASIGLHVSHSSYCVDSGDVLCPTTRSVSRKACSCVNRGANSSCQNWTCSFSGNELMSRITDASFFMTALICPVSSMIPEASRHISELCLRRRDLMLISNHLSSRSCARLHRSTYSCNL
jgi:hypothetical protein